MPRLLAVALLAVLIIGLVERTIRLEPTLALRITRDGRQGSDIEVTPGDPKLRAGVQVRRPDDLRAGDGR
jgi:hypothetical protein